MADRTPAAYINGRLQTLPGGDTVPSSLVSNSGFCSGRLTLVSGNPLVISDSIAANLVYFTPFMGNRLSLWSGSIWSTVIFQETAIALSNLVPFQVYDVFAYTDTANALNLELNEWKNSQITISIASPCVITWASHGLSNGDKVILTTTGTLPSGLTPNIIYYVTNATTNTFNLQSLAATGFSTANTTGSQSGTHTAHCNTQRQAQVSIQDGVYCKTGDKTRLLIGSVAATSSTTTENSYTNVLVSNVFNAYRRVAKKNDQTNHTYSTSAWRAWNNSINSTQVNVLSTLPRSILMQSSGLQGVSSGGSNYGITEIFINGAQVLNSLPSWGSGSTTDLKMPNNIIAESILTGFHAIYIAENGQGSVNSWFGTAQITVTLDA